MIAVLGSEFDEAARDLVDAWSKDGAVLLSARDLCTRGWAFHATTDADGFFVAGGVRRPTEDLRGVVVRRPAVAAEELSVIAEEDRHYVAAEINAFLVAWLSALPCPVFNRPTATSLCGPAWSQTHWKLAAARAGIMWSDDFEAEASRDVIFCRQLNYGAASEQHVHVGATLGVISGADLLGVRFSGDAVAAVTLQPALAVEGARAVVLANLRVRAAE